MDGKFVASKKGSDKVGIGKKGKGSKIMAIVNSDGLPISIFLDSASPHESKLVDQTLRSRFSNYCPKKIIGDKAYDSDTLDLKLKKQYGVELLAPHKKNRVARPTQDKRELKGYCDRYKFERFFAWLDSFKRTAIRNEVKSENFLGMVKLASVMILLRNL